MPLKLSIEMFWYLRVTCFQSKCQADKAMTTCLKWCLKSSFHIMPTGPPGQSSVLSPQESFLTNCSSFFFFSYIWALHSLVSSITYHYRLRSLEKQKLFLMFMVQESTFRLTGLKSHLRFGIVFQAHAVVGRINIIIMWLIPCFLPGCWLGASLSQWR